MLTERLTEDEAALVAILTDPSGSELAEFAYEDPQGPDGRWRLWDFQWVYNHCEEKYQVDACGRGIGKSQGSVLRACAFPFNFPGQELLVTAPELSHLSLITDKVEEALLKYRILREMLPGAGKNARSNGIKKQPQFQASFTNGAKILSRLPQRDGKGVKGPHPLGIILDELQDFPRKGFTELTETIKISEPGAMWRCHGVSNGIGDIHYDLTNSKIPDMPFYVHRYIASHRPSWNAAERKAKIAMYGGSEESPDYIRNIFGEPGSAHNAVFVLARLMANVRLVHSSAWATEYNERIYRHIKVVDENRRGMTMASLMEFPKEHLDPQYSSYWAGMDVGFTTDPSEILIFGVVARPGQPDQYRLLSRVSMQRISAQHQVEAIEAIFSFYGPRLRRMGMDKTGNGLPLFQLLKAIPGIGARIAGYGFSEKKAVEFDDRELRKGETPEDAVIVKSVIDFATDTLRKWVDANAFELPADTELLNQWQAQTVHIVRSGNVSKEHSLRRYAGTGPDHTLDAARMFALGKELEAIEQLLEAPKPAEPVLDAFF